jgi:hypothetical protein
MFQPGDKVRYQHTKREGYVIETITAGLENYAIVKWSYNEFTPLDKICTIHKACMDQLVKIPYVSMPLV